MNEKTKRRLRWAVWATSGLVVVLAVLVSGLLALMRHEFGRSPPPARDPKPQSVAEANRQDLAYLRQLPDYDRSFSPEAKAAFGRYLDTVTAKAGDLDGPGLEMAVARAAALADNGHTNAQGVAEGRGLDTLPIRLVKFTDGFHVVMATAANADLLGALVVSEEGRSVDDLERALRPYHGGSAELLREKLPNFLQSPQALHAVGLAVSANEARFEFALPDGRRIERTLAAESGPTPTYRWADRALSPVRTRQLALAQPWTHVLDGQSVLPAYLRRADTAYWHQFLDDTPAVYIQLNASRSSGERPIGAYLDDLLDQVASNHPRYAIVDLRFNGGGDYTLFADVSRKLPKLLPPDGKLYIVTGPNTFSAAITTAARLKHFAGAKGVIVGEPVGDRDQFWGEVQQFRLPNSKIPVQYATGYHDWVNGCHSWTKCYWLNFGFLMGVAAGPLTPTLPAPLSFADYRAGVDPAFRAIAGDLSKP